ncbi:MAG: anti-sigma F factor [Clostridiales bacterium]|nr:anti-sigma F factor [Clostridiales bacterium]
MEQFHLEIDSRSRNEEFARVVAATFLSRLDPTLEEVNDVKTAVSEAVTNAEIHGYGGGEGTIDIRGRIEERTFTVEVSDQGVGIPDIQRAMEPLFTTDQTGERSGMGFSFMVAFMDGVFVESEPGRGTKVVMRKEIGR